MNAQFIGLGVGPGDPELITLKAHRLMQNADVVSYLANEQGSSQARDIAQHSLEGSKAGQIEIPVPMPMKNDRTAANQAYDLAADKIRSVIAEGQNVVFLCEGDPLFFGSFSYLLDRLQDEMTCAVVPGISSVHAASSALKLPLSMLKESVAIINGRHSEEKIRQTLQQHDSVIIMKAGPYRPKILAALADTGRSSEANYLEYIGRDEQVIIDDVSQLGDDKGPYFSLFVVLKKERQR
ncbi:MAG: precorrin-2 C(20)-methyltransferase [Oleispira sp.]|nr:precorrin-2 C(20)-methyltransferase [Oleispira sp.]MBL4882675.1 precorrin-2 C(20)-methyltransferase [Oleispira sp.]